MLVVISPAKKLDWAPRETEMTTPDFGEDALRLVETARDLTPGDLKKLMHLSDKLAELNHARFRDYAEEPEVEALRPAALAFAGDTYQGLDATSLDPEEMDYAQDHLRILSGLYGVLRPRDAIQPYRLEMGSRLKTERGKSLYDYWGAQLSGALNAQGEATGSDVLVNCASQEYFGAVDPEALKLRVITPQFLEDKDGAPKVVSFYAKRARGAMARFIVTRRITDPEALRDFDLGGYAYDEERSTEDQPVFVRPYSNAA
ncbi:peroxide stress protein YaaA [Alloyangia pacifica]|uniref:peroxide stress protein YaaA n=1 Tax=Alloyangia pacifica TaxID=311180 RepID=UPI001CFEED9C|nr:peroxide stress protein YaaA [Alloyangia pacifica]